MFTLSLNVTLTEIMFRKYRAPLSHHLFLIDLNSNPISAFAVKNNGHIYQITMEEKKHLYDLQPLYPLVPVRSKCKVKKKAREVAL